MKKHNQFGLWITKTIQVKDGELSMLISLLEMTLTERRVNKVKDMVSLLMNHSTSDPSFLCRELLNVLVLTISFSRSGPRTERLSNSDSMVFQRPLEACTGLLTYFQRKETTLDAEP
jgi:hypothetical protein